MVEEFEIGNNYEAWILGSEYYKDKFKGAYIQIGPVDGVTFSLTVDSVRYFTVFKRFDAVEIMTPENGSVEIMCSTHFSVIRFR